MYSMLKNLWRINLIDPLAFPHRLAPSAAQLEGKMKYLVSHKNQHDQQQNQLNYPELCHTRLDCFCY